jgi:hypothetical protein
VGGQRKRWLAFDSIHPTHPACSLKYRHIFPFFLDILLHLFPDRAAVNRKRGWTDLIPLRKLVQVDLSPPMVYKFSMDHKK